MCRGALQTICLCVRRIRPRRNLMMALKLARCRQTRQLLFHRSSILATVAIALGHVPFSRISAFAADSARPPNVVIIFTADLGDAATQRTGTGHRQPGRLPE
jgi:hypothetical protein